MANITIGEFTSFGQSVYELNVNELSNPIESHAYFESLSSDPQIVDVKRNVDENLAADGSWTSLQLDLYKHLIRGLTEYNASQYVLRETKNVSKRSTVTASFTNVNRMDTPPNVAAANTLIGSIPTQEWLKKSPVVRQTGTRRWQIVTEWWGATKLSSVLYGGTLTYT